MSRKDIANLARIMRGDGWEVERSGHHHWKFISPTGQIVFAPSTPSDPRSYLNVRAKLLRAGATILRRSTRRKRA